jgi:excisionase family DNA binding protein
VSGLTARVSICLLFRYTAGMADEFLTVGEVAASWRCAPVTVYRAIQAGQLEAVRRGPRQLLVPREALQDYLAKCSTAATTKAG